MRIAIIAPLVAPISDPPLGGAQTMLADLSTGLSARGHQVDVFAASGSVVEGARVVDTGIDSATIAGTRVRPGWPRPPAAISHTAFGRVYTMVRAGAYDAVHNHAFDAAAIRLASGAAPRVVHTLHLPPEAGVAEALREARRGSPRPVVVAVSAAQAADWQPSAPVDAVIRNGVPASRIPWAATSGNGTVFAGRLSPEKGAHEAIEIARAAGVEIDVYGDHYDREYARTMIEPRAHLPGVRVHPQLGRHDLWRRMCGAAAVVCPALWEEPFGLVAAEAQATGTPVIAYRRGGLTEIIVDGVTGFLVTSGDISGAAGALRAARRLSRAGCRRHAEADLDLEPVLAQHERIYTMPDAPRTTESS